MFVSVIIPTYRDWQRLSTCLNALSRQSYPVNKFEIIVVNNNPSDAVPGNYVIPENCRIVTEAKPGSYAARNTGLKMSSGEIIAFTDSDCVPHSNWLKNAVEFMANHPQYARLAGKISLFYKDESLTTAELYEKVYAFKQDFAVSKGASVTGNMFAARKVFDKIGQFNETLLSGGDYEWSIRAEKEGFRIAYGENAVVEHPARYSMKELVKKSKRTAAYFGKSKLSSISRLIKYAIPPINSFLHSRDLKIQESVVVFSVRYYLNLVRGVEEVKISFGKQASRE